MIKAIHVPDEFEEKPRMLAFVCENDALPAIDMAGAMRLQYNYQCHFVRGSELAEYRMGNVREKLKQLVLEEERVELHELSITDYSRIPEIMDNFLEVIETAGPNPYKGM
jgi:quinone-modifying oxidoreductase subunit QmoB